MSDMKNLILFRYDCKCGYAFMRYDGAFHNAVFTDMVLSLLDNVDRHTDILRFLPILCMITSSECKYDGRTVQLLGRSIKYQPTQPQNQRYDVNIVNNFI